MPVRSLSSSVIRWPDDKTVGEALQEWALETKRNRQEVLEIGYFGMYARGDWGVGSDLAVKIDLPGCGQEKLHEGFSAGSSTRLSTDIPAASRARRPV